MDIGTRQRCACNIYLYASALDLHNLKIHQILDCSFSYLTLFHFRGAAIKARRSGRRPAEALSMA